MKTFGKYDLQTVAAIYLSRELVESSDELHLYRFLGTLLSKKLRLEEKRTILEEEYQLPLTGKIGRRINIMCNLGEGIWEEGIEQGRQDMIYRMFQSGLPFEQVKVIVQDKVSDEMLREIERAAAEETNTKA